MDSEKALDKLSSVPIYEEDEHNVITDIDSCCIYKGDLCEVYESEFDTIKKDLEVLEILKDHIVYYPSDKYIMICVHKDKKEDFNKVKEWIEREQ